MKDIWGLGKKTLENLQNFNITTIGQLRQIDLPMLQKIVGKSGGTFLYNAARGIDPGIYTNETKNSSISSEITFGTDTKDREGIRLILLDLADQIMFRLMEHGYRGKLSSLKYVTQILKPSPLRPLSLILLELLMKYITRHYSYSKKMGPRINSPPDWPWNFIC